MPVLGTALIQLSLIPFPKKLPRVFADCYVIPSIPGIIWPFIPYPNYRYLAGSIAVVCLEFLMWAVSSRPLICAERFGEGRGLSEAQLMFMT